MSRSRNIALLLVPGLAWALATEACSPRDTTPMRTNSEPEPTAEEPTAAAAGLRPTNPKAYGATPDRDLGTLPAGVGLAVGSTAPDLAGEDADGQRRRLSELAAERPILLLFYRGGW